MKIRACGSVAFLSLVAASSPSSPLLRGHGITSTQPPLLPDTTRLARNLQGDAKMYSVYFFQWFSQGGGVKAANGGGGCRTPEPAPILSCGGEGEFEIIDFYLSDHDCTIDGDDRGTMTCSAHEKGAIAVACKGNDLSDLEITATLPSTTVFCDGGIGDFFKGSSMQWAYLYTSCNGNFIVRDEDTCSADWVSSGTPYCSESGICTQVTPRQGPGGPTDKDRDPGCSMSLAEVSITSKESGDEGCVYDPPEPEPYCGDGECDFNEDTHVCPEDCPSFCGDGICNEDENHSSCPDDCPAVCGDGTCDEEEDRLTCPSDCAVCGDSHCDDDESRSSCPQDCPAVCGDGVCDTEDLVACPSDCGGGIAMGEESVGQATATEDKSEGQATEGSEDGSSANAGDNASGESDTSTIGGESTSDDNGEGLVVEEGSQDQGGTPAFCGDGNCDRRENHSNCPQDCPVACGDGTCDGDEDRTNCPVDCVPIRPCAGGCPPNCGDGVCSPHEDIKNCPEDCSLVDYSSAPRLGTIQISLYFTFTLPLFLL